MRLERLIKRLLAELFLTASLMLLGAATTVWGSFLAAFMAVWAINILIGAHES